MMDWEAVGWGDGGEEGRVYIGLRVYKTNGDSMHKNPEFMLYYDRKTLQKKTAGTPMTAVRNSVSPTNNHPRYKICAVL